MKFACMCIALAFAISLYMAPASAQGNTPRTIKGGVLNGKAISLPKPEYPAEARKAAVDGLVSVEVTIDESGTVILAKAITDEKPNTDLATETADGLAQLREAAERAAMEARFSPTLLGGKPVKVTGVITYKFSLSTRIDDDEKNISGGVLNGKAIDVPDPEYPEAARAAKVSGTVAVQVTVDEAGNVISARAVFGHPLLQAAAVAAARVAKFAPTRLEGQPVKVSGIITYNFVLPEN